MDMLTKYATPVSQQLVAAGKWLSGLNGAGVAACFALIATNYGAISQTGSCQSLKFISDIIIGTSRLARIFVAGASFSIFAVCVPGAVGIARNAYRIRHSRTLNNVNAVDIGKEFEGYQEIAVTIIIVIQTAALLSAAIMFFHVIFQILHYANFESYQQINNMWIHFGAECPKQK